VSDPPRSKELIVVAIDGPSGAGKSTVAAMLARQLDVPYVDTGAMYRAVALMALRGGVRLPLDDDSLRTVRELGVKDRISVEVVGGALQILVDGRDVHEEIRTPECSAMASAVSAIPDVRRSLVPIQRELVLRSGGVLEGRDTATVVFPDATLKVFLTASSTQRAQRRQAELERRGIETSLEQVQREQQERDLRDTTRRDSPLQVAQGALVVDSTGMSPDEVVARLLAELEKLASDRLTAIGRTP
jgi:cytidylate kinase